METKKLKPTEQIEWCAINQARVTFFYDVDGGKNVTVKVQGYDVTKSELGKCIREIDRKRVLKSEKIKDEGAGLIDEDGQLILF